MSNKAVISETLSSSCLELKEALLLISDPQKRKARIIEHILQLLPLDSSVPDFQTGLEWFNCIEPLSLQHQLKKKIVILDFFTYCCINCMHILPHLKLLEERFPVEDGLVVVGVHSAKFENEKDSLNIAAALKRYNVTHPVVNDSDGFLWTQLELFCWPTLIVLGPGGQPLFQFVGEGHEKALFECVEVALEYFRLRGDLSPHNIMQASAPDTSVQRSPLSFPGKVTCTSQEDGTELIAISNTGSHTIVVVSEDGFVKHIIGHNEQPGFTDGDFTTAHFNSPQGLVFLSSSILYVADTGNHAIRKIDLKNRSVMTVAGNGIQGSDLIGGSIGAEQSLSSPWDLCIVRRTYPVAKPFLCICPAAPPGYCPRPPPPPYPGPPRAPRPPPPPYPGHPPATRPPPPPPPCDSKGDTGPLDHDKSEEILLIAMAGSHQIWGLFLQDTIWWKGELFRKGVCAALAGNGSEENRNNAYPRSAAFAQPSGLAYSESRKEVYIADSESSSVRCLHTETGKVTAIVGGSKSPNDLFCYGDVDGDGYDVRLQHPLGIAWDGTNSCLYLADSYNHKIKRILPDSKTCSTVIGSNIPSDCVPGSDSKLNEPGGICMSVDHLKMYIADTNNHSIKVVHLSDWTIQKLHLKTPPQEPHGDRDDGTLSSSVIAHHDGTITLHVKVSLPKGVKPTEGAPQRWMLKLPSSMWKSDANEGRFDPYSTLKVTIKAPQSPPEDASAMLLFTVKLFLCADGACRAASCSHRISVSFAANAPQNVIHQFAMVIN